MLIACGLLLGNKTTPNFFEMSYCIINSIVAKDIFASFLRYKNIYDVDKNTRVKLTVKGLNISKTKDYLRFTLVLLIR